MSICGIDPQVELTRLDKHSLMANYGRHVILIRTNFSASAQNSQSPQYVCIGKEEVPTTGKDGMAVWIGKDWVGGKGMAPATVSWIIGIDGANIGAAVVKGAAIG